MDFARLYLSSDGMINRKVWWLGNIGLVVIAFLAIMFFGSLMTIIGLGEIKIALNLMGFAITLVTLYLFYNLSVKRLRDRERSVSLAMVFTIPSIISQILQMTGITGSLQLQDFMGRQVEMFTPNLFGHIVSLIIFGIGIWSIIELGILPGRQASATTMSDSSPDH